LLLIIDNTSPRARKKDPGSTRDQKKDSEGVKVQEVTGGVKNKKDFT